MLSASKNNRRVASIQNILAFKTSFKTSQRPNKVKDTAKRLLFATLKVQENLFSPTTYNLACLCPPPPCQLLDSTLTEISDVHLVLKQPLFLLTTRL